ncbi:AAA family ATPase [Scytonema sp. NUACC26]|uniref:trifunctional serine/threonine-protein kinase/ATP-binding protein/sensor histidine kinase n=1 Tax=Scytonema sp. NUACC26 TaxID=3140176 RepID=UPI0034DBFC8B
MLVSPQLPGYNFTETIHSGVNTIIYRYQSQLGSQPIILKLLKAVYPTLEAIARFKYEYQIQKNLEHSNIVKAIRLETFNNQLGLVLEDFNGFSLAQRLKTEKLSLVSCLSIAIQIVQALNYLHKNQIIHKDIKPSNIIINPDTGVVKLIDFGVASQLNQENPQFKNPNSQEGTLVYMSPEQTGRMNRSLDYRSDFYSLGVTLYEMLAGKLPFLSHDPLEVVYSHIATQPTSLQLLNPEIPSAVSEIVMKLMAKNAEDRYQSDEGLLADLEICHQQLATNDRVTDFTPGRLDILSQLLIPQKLYGRETQVQELLAAFQRVTQGNSELMLVSGYSGIGKSAVVNEISKPITRQKGYFISGKFDQFQRNIPYASLVQAFSSLMRQLLTENTEQIEQWRTRILAVLGKNGLVIIDVIPELELIIGKQPEVPQLGATESQNRFNRSFQEFIGVFTRIETPLAIFLDDLQWADLATLKLMQLLMSDRDRKYLLFIGAYRDREVNPTDPLMQILEEMKKSGTVVNNIVLQPLALEHVTQLVAETLNEKEQSYSLANLLYNKTAGNPFFITQLLQALYQEKLLTFNFKSTHWQWSIEQIQAIGITEKSIVELIASRIEKLPEITQNVLKLAACVGNTFTLDVLSIISEQSSLTTAEQLINAMVSGLILPLNEAYRLPLVLNEKEAIHFKLDSSRVRYKFLHDRVQQAAYSLIPEEQKKKTHLRIGQLLLQNTLLEEIETNIFDIVNQLNIGIDTLTKQNELNELAKLNLIAGRRANAAAAHEPALKYLRQGLKLLTNDSWQNQYKLTLNLYIETMEAEFLNANFEQVETLAEIILNNAVTQLDLLKLYEIKIQMYINNQQVHKAFNTGLQALEKLGYSLSKIQSYARPNVTIPNLDDLELLPKMTAPDELAVMRLLILIIDPALNVNPEICFSIVLAQVNLYSERGYSAFSAFTYSYYSMLQCGFGEIEKGYYAGLLAVKFLEQFNVKFLKCQVYLIFNSFVKPWKEHIRESIKPLIEGLQAGLEVGCLNFAGYCAENYNTLLFLSGEALETVEIKQSVYTNLMQKIGNDYIVSNISIWRQLNLSLQNLRVSQHQPIWSSLDETISLQKLQETNNGWPLFNFYLAKAILLYLFKDSKGAVAHTSLANNYAKTLGGFIPIAINNFYNSLSLLGHYFHAQHNERQKYLSQVETNQKKMKIWAEYAPLNFKHKYELVEAEKARVLGNNSVAIDYYDRAIKGAKDNDYIQDEALAYELAGEFYKSFREETMFQSYLTKAYYAYIHWGAVAKVKDLESTYPFLLAQTRVDTKTSVDDMTTIITNTTTTDGLDNALDLNTFIKFSQIISSEIVLENLLSQSIKILIENAAAQKGVLLLFKGNSLHIEAMAEDNRTIVLQSIPFESSHSLPILIVNYVVRTQEPLVLENTNLSKIFSIDPYIQREEPKSILCLPILYQANIQGVIYLENKLAVGVFTSKRVKILKILVPQVAIAIENARLYAREQEKSLQLEQSLKELQNTESKLLLYAKDLEKTLHKLQKTQTQLVHTEKISSLGQLVAGVAHEVNNPVSFINGNLFHAKQYIEDLMNLLHLYQKYVPQPPADILEEIEAINLEDLLEDLPQMISSMQVGTSRIRDIMQSLRNFSRNDGDDKRAVDIHEGIETTLMILSHRLKAQPARPAIQIIKNYGSLPQVECYPGQLNQVFMNILANAIDALEESNQDKTYAELQQNPNVITISTTTQDSYITINIADNGIGMTNKVRQQLFNNFFTTKPEGKGTGLGLSISYEIITEKHSGTLECISSLGEGTKFVIQIPQK